ncbi:diacylglycerol kinase variant A [Cryptosporidium xiaoi]|uniref:diacylglycerol kinase (ATP) n=1 Tax=Cryptosporidium xiaoi TaxID=659607 RepID=A0AAV9XZQ7_9CRYT
MSQKGDSRENFFEAETLDYSTTSDNVKKNEALICNNCKLHEIQLSVFREYIGDPLAFIFLFYNKLSGGNIESYFSNRLKEIVLDVDGIMTHISFVDMISEMDIGVKYVKNSLKLTSKDVCIIGIGGDGSLSTLVNLFLEEIPESEERLVFAVLPFGTGNDWARNFGWSSYGNIKFMKDDFVPLVDLARGIFTSKVINFDLWMIEVELINKEDSCFLRVNPFTQELQRMETCRDDNEIEELKSSIINKNVGVNNKLLKLKKRCLNYFSFGEESRVGITFDTYRKKNVLINRALYGLAGSVFSVNLKNKQQNIPLSHSTQGVYLIDKNQNIFQHDNFSCALCPNGIKHTMSSLNIKENTDEEDINICPTLSNSVSLVFLNIETFGGGIHLWKNSKNLGHSISSDSSKTNINLGEMVGTISSLLTSPITLQVEQNETNITNLGVNSTNGTLTENEKGIEEQFRVLSSKKTDKKEYSSEREVIREKILNIIPSSCDKKMEIMSFSGLIDISSIFLPYMSTARRVGQFSPFETGNKEEQNLVILFNENQVNNSESSNLIEMYFQIDGEYYLAKEPKQCTLKYDRTIRILNCILPYSPFVLK